MNKNKLHKFFLNKALLIIVGTGTLGNEINK